MREAMRVLIVDDNPDHRFILGKTLDKLGVLHEGVRDPTSVLGLLRARTGTTVDFDAVITDQSMPYLDGAQLTEKIAGEFPDKRRILLTSYPASVPTPNAAHAVLAKPASCADLGKHLFE
jgi:CheY-like chemotaxis protein